jgi:hypothetical protein
MPQANSQTTTNHSARVTPSEALFLRCILQCQYDFGAKPAAELALPRSIGVVVDYDYVKRMMFTKMLRGDDNTDEGRARHRERTKSALKAARMGLMALDVVGSSDPFIWWTGKPVRGIGETQKNDPALFGPPFPTFASKTRERKHREPVILRPVEHGFTADGRPGTRCIVVSGHAEAGLRPPRRARTAKTAVA